MIKGTIWGTFSLLFILSLPALSENAGTTESFWAETLRYSGELRQETAYRIGSPKKFNKIKEYAKIDLKLTLNDYLKLKLGGRAFYDAVYDLTDQFPDSVNDDMDKQGALRDAYLDVSIPKTNIRIGHQQIVWGESLGQFFADVVTPKDLREFFLPDFEDVRMPIWALDIQNTFLPNASIEGIVSPDLTVNKFALPGADFAFFTPPPPPGVTVIALPDQRPETDFEHWNAGGRLSYLVSGWDLAGFYYTSLDHNPALFKVLSVDPSTGNSLLTVTPLHKRVHHFGTTFSKAIESTVFRGEIVYTDGRFFNAEDFTQNQGVIRSDQIRYTLGMDQTLGERLNVNLEFQQDAILESRDKISDEIIRSWIFFRLETGFMEEKVIPEMIFIIGLDELDTQVSPRLHYHITSTLIVTAGVDIFSGPKDGLYGQFGDSDRIFFNTRLLF